MSKLTLSLKLYRHFKDLNNQIKKTSYSKNKNKMIRLLLLMLLVIASCCNAIDIKKSHYNVTLPDSRSYDYRASFEDVNGKNFSLVLRKEEIVSGFDCFYVGFDENAHRGSNVLLNNCLNETWGVVARTRNEYSIEANGEILNTNDSAPLPPCSVNDPPPYLPMEKNRLFSFDEHNDMETNRMRYIRINVVTDKAFYNLKGEDLTKSVVNSIGYMIYIYRSFSSEFNVTVQLESITHLKDETAPWDDKTDASDILRTFNDWTTQRRASHRSSYILITGIDLLGSTVGIAYLRSMCRGYASAIVQGTYPDAVIGKIAAHEVGHNIGLYHTNTYMDGTAITSEDSKKCSVNYYSVMSPSISGTGFIWDDCSRNWWKMEQDGYPFGCKGYQCTYTTPAPFDCYAGSTNTCGDGVVQPGEECDGIDDPCCTNECKFVKRCSFQKSKCCNLKCRPRRKGRQCEAPKDLQCANVSSCNGKSPECPKLDYYDGKICQVQGDVGRCYQGECLNHLDQCLSINKAYGYGIKSECPTAIYGDSACGALSCMTNAASYCLQFYAPEYRMVKDGTPCSRTDSSVCKNRKCVLPAS